MATPRLSTCSGLGNTFRLPGLQRFLEDKLQLSVRKLQQLECVVGDTVLTAQGYSENIKTFAVAYGLALQGLKRTRLQTNLLPPEIRRERLIRAKKPWVVAMAAALLIGLGSVAAGCALTIRAYRNPDLKAAIKTVKAAHEKATKAATRFNNTKAAALREAEGARSVVIGQQDFLNWLELTRFINQSLPRADGFQPAQQGSQRQAVASQMEKRGGPRGAAVQLPLRLLRGQQERHPGGHEWPDCL